MANRESSGSQGGSSPARRDKSRSPARRSLSPARRGRSPARRSCSPARSRRGRSCSREWPSKSHSASESDSDDESSDDSVEGERQSEAEGENNELAHFITKLKRADDKTVTDAYFGDGKFTKDARVDLTHHYFLSDRQYKRMMPKDQDRDGAGKIQRAAEFSQI